MKKYIMALDAGTTSNRCILFNDTKFREFLMGEVRFNSLMKATPEEAERLFQATENDAKWKLNGYKRLAAMEYGK